jgi:hypothetical protein
MPIRRLAPREALLRASLHCDIGFNISDTLAFQGSRRERARHETGPFGLVSC